MCDVTYSVVRQTYRIRTYDIVRDRDERRRMWQELDAPDGPGLRHWHSHGDGLLRALALIMIDWHHLESYHPLQLSHTAIY